VVERADEDGIDHLLHRDQATMLATVLDIVNALPAELWPNEREAYEDVLFATAAIRHKLATWETGNNPAPLSICRGKRRHPVVLLYNAFRQCPDNVPAPATVELAFIADAELRASIRQDISTATSALGNGEWKAATVLAGAAVEALLLWRLQTEPAAHLAPVRATLRGAGLINTQNLALDQWSLAALIRGARELNVIGADAERGATNAQHFRNLIHPGRAQRVGAACHRGTAFAALAAVHLVAVDIG
jgi:hypothetical protein